MSVENRRPKLWFICSNFGAVSQRWLYRQAVGMNNLDVHVITKNWIDPAHSPGDGITVEVIPVRTKLPLGRFRRYAEFLRNWRYDFFLGTTEELNWWRKRIERDRPDAILCHFGTTAARLMPVFKNLGVPVVAHFNGNDLSGQLRKRNYRWRLLRCLPQLAGCVIVADYMREWLINHGYPESRIRMIPYGTPMAELPIASRVNQQPCRFVGVGRFTEKKRPDLTIQAFKRCLESCPEAELTMGGDGELLLNCQRLVGELGIGNKVRFLGSLSSAQVKEELSKSSVFVQHSVTGSDGDKEGWPVAIAEAAGAGLPVIATAHAGILSQVDNGRTGFLVAEGDWMAMADKMIVLAKSPDLRVSMGKAAREKMAGFDTQHQVADLEKFLLETAGIPVR
jgi:colanic acid/amylovoran biosynthesis glycosyltransferase